MTMIEQFGAARRVSAPLFVVRTVDQIATAASIATAVTDAAPVVQWDAVRGITAMNSLGDAALTKANIVSEDTVGFVEAMVAAQLLPRATVLIAFNAHRQLLSSEPMATAVAVQAVANLREPFKKSFRMAVFLAPGFKSPIELEQEIIVADAELPTGEALAQTIKDLHVSASLDAPEAETLARSAEALNGLSAYAAETQAAMSLTRTGMDVATLWERKRVTIEQTRGLRVWRGKETFDDLVGLDAIKVHLRRRIKSRTPLGVVLWLDEIDKVFANVEHDTSGVKLDQFRTFLTEMENAEMTGMVCVGVAGGGKSLIAKALGNEAGVLNIALDMGDMEGSHVGESEAMVRQAWSIIKAVGGGHAYVIATSNNASVMRPEFQRRFTDGFFFFDLMSAEERAAAWAFYVKRYALAAQPFPEDEGWTGAEIRNCCRSAWDMDITLVQAAEYIVPMARSRADDIDSLRRYAHGRFLDASKPGTYSYESQAMATMLRAIELPGKAN